MRGPRISAWIAAAVILVAITHAIGTSVAKSATSLTVDGEVRTRLTLGAADLAAMPRAKASVHDDSGTSAVYEGVPVLEILKRAGAALGTELRGPNMTLCVVAGGSDGYQVVFALAEFDPGFTDEVILLADHRDDQPLNSREGPLRLIVPNDRRHARWVRGVVTLMLRNAR